MFKQEQIQLKKKFNVVVFNTKARAWKEKLVDVTESSIIDAWHWIKSVAFYQFCTFILYYSDENLVLYALNNY